MRYHSNLTSKALFVKIKARSVNYAGNARLKIYGKLDCTSGKRMKKTSRVFFKTVAEAVTLGFRPCGHCMRKDYLEWKANR